MLMIIITNNNAEDARNTVPWNNVIEDLNDEKLLGTFYLTNCK